MWPLLKREQLGIQYLVSIVSYNHLIGYNPLRLIGRSTRNLLSSSIMLIYLLMVGIHIAEQLIKPPSRLPDLFAVLNLSLSFLIFIASYFWSLLRIYEEAWTLVGFGALKGLTHETRQALNKAQQDDEQDEVATERSGVEEENEEDEMEAVNVKLPTKRSSSLQQHRRKKSGSESESEELKSQSFGAKPRKIKLGQLTKRMLKEPETGSRPSSKMMISSPSGEKLMNRIKNRLQVRSTSPSSSSSTSHPSSSHENRRSNSKGKEKEDDQSRSGTGDQALDSERAGIRPA